MEAAQPNFFAQKVLTKGCATEFHHIGYTTYEDAINEGGPVLGGLHPNKGRQSVYSTLVNPLDKHPNPKI